MITTPRTNDCPHCLHHYETRPLDVTDACEGCQSPATCRVVDVGPDGAVTDLDTVLCEACARYEIAAGRDPMKHDCDACQWCHSEAPCKCRQCANSGCGNLGTVRVDSYDVFCAGCAHV